MESLISLGIGPCMNMSLGINVESIDQNCSVDPTAEDPAGNENIYKIPRSGGSFSHSLRFDLTRKDGHKAYEEYEIVHIDNEANKYKLIEGGYSGTAGDALTGFGKTGNNSQYFSTYDQDNGEFLFNSCAVKYRGGWWY